MAQRALVGALLDFDVYYKPFIQKVNLGRGKMIDEL